MTDTLPTAIARHLDDAVARCPDLAGCASDIRSAFALLREAFRAGQRVYLCGNGGSAADCDHWAGELLKGFESPRDLASGERTGLSGPLGEKLQGGLPMIPLTGFTAARTAIGNDQGPDLEFAQLVHALGRDGDVLIGITTSGNSSNVCNAARVARYRKLRVLGLTGADGGDLAALSDVVVRVPRTRTLEVQELHLPVYHTLSLMLEEAFFG